MGHNTKNYRLQGGERIVIGGEVVLAAEAVIDDQRPYPIRYTPPSTAEIGTQHYYCIISEQSDAATKVFEPTVCVPTTVTVSAE